MSTNLDYAWARMDATLTAQENRKRFSVDEYHRMVKVGILRDQERLELIDGEIIQMSAIGHRHWVCVNVANTLFVKSFDQAALVSIQNSIQLDEWTEPEPDVVVFKPRSDFYAAKKPTPEDVLFIVEVADSSLNYDRKVKLPRYAQAHIPEVWIEDLVNDVLRIYREPMGEDYGLTQILKRGELISPQAFPRISFKVDDLLASIKALG